MISAVGKSPDTMAARFVKPTSPLAKKVIVGDSRRTIPAKRLRRCRVPSDLVVTPIVIVGLAKRMSTQALENIIEHLIREVDNRAGDPDLEQEQDGCDDDFPYTPASNRCQRRAARVETITFPIIKQQESSNLLTIMSSS